MAVQESPDRRKSWGSDVLRHPPPELARTILGEWPHDADGGAALEAVDQEVGQFASPAESIF